MFSFLRKSEAFIDPDEPLVFILVEGDPKGDEDLFAIRMVRSTELGGAEITVGPALALTWSSISTDGVGALDAVSSIPPDSQGNTDLGPKKGRFRRRKTVLAVREPEKLSLTPEKRRGGYPMSMQEDEIVLELPKPGAEIETAVREAFARAR